MFELLAPMFAMAGGLLAGIPVLLHMLRRTPAVRMPFSVVRFLSPTLPSTTKRSTIEHWPLMLLRILAVGLIALAFARPFQRLAIDRTAVIENADRVAVLVDASASMRRDGLRESVVAEVRRVFDELNLHDTLSLTVFSESQQTLIRSEEWKSAAPGSRSELIERAIESYTPDWLSTQTANALLELADEVSQEALTSKTGERRVVLITDFQQGSSLDELRSGKWPDSVKLELRIVEPQQRGNAGLSLVEDDRLGRFRVRVTNSGDAPTTKYLLQTFDVKGQPTGKQLVAEVTGGQRRTFTLPETVPGSPQIAGVEILGDPHNFDNVADLPMDERAAIRVGHAGATDANNSETMRYYLQRALDGNEINPVEITDLLGADGVAISPPENLRLVFVTESIPERLATSLDSVLQRGGIIVLALKSVGMTDSLKSLLPPGLSVTEADVRDYAMIGQIDFSSLFFSPFSDARFSDFSSIRFRHFRQVIVDGSTQAAVRVLARFDSGDPAVLEFSHPSGGRVIVLSSGWHPEDSQWALSTRFPPMMQRLVDMANPQQSRHQLLEVGNRITPSQFFAGETWTLTRPGGEPYVPEAAATTLPDANDSAEESSSNSGSLVLDEPGRWTLTGHKADTAESVNFLVTVAASESRTEPLPAGQLEALGMASGNTVVRGTSRKQADPARAAQLDAAELESGQNLWRWLLLAGLACLILEQVVSYVLEKRQQPELA